MAGAFTALSFLLFIALIAVTAYHSRKVSQLIKKVYEGRSQAQQMFQVWVQQYSQQSQQQIEQAVRRQYQARLKTWKQQHEQEIRRNTVLRSVNTLLGKITEEPPFLARCEPEGLQAPGGPCGLHSVQGAIRRER